jgi:uncharacterized Tic20 family protein
MFALGKLVNVSKLLCKIQSGYQKYYWWWTNLIAWTTKRTHESSSDFQGATGIVLQVFSKVFLFKYDKIFFIIINILKLLKNTKNKYSSIIDMIEEE